MALLLKKILKVFRIPSPDRVRKPALVDSALGKLPAELFLEIADFLPPESIACFALSCRVICDILGVQCFAAVKQDPSTCYAFLSQLEVDMPDVVTCRPCLRFHAMSNATSYRYRRRNQLCRSEDLAAFIPFTLHYEFSSTVMQMAMKRSRQGLNVQSLLALLEMTPRQIHVVPLVCHGQSDVKIVNGHLLFRKLHRVELLAGTDLRLPSRLNVRVCPHFSITPSKALGCMLDLWNINKPSWFDPADLRSWQGLAQCKHCTTEFSVEYKWRDEIAMDLAVSVWKDLGGGKYDREWQLQIVIDWEKSQEACSFPPGSIRDAFERPTLLPEEKKTR